VAPCRRGRRRPQLLVVVRFLSGSPIDPIVPPCSATSRGFTFAPRLCAAEKADYFFGSDLFGHNVRRVRPLAMPEAIADADWT